MSIRSMAIAACLSIALLFGGIAFLDIRREMALLENGKQIEESTQLRSLLGAFTNELSAERALTQITLTLSQEVSPYLRQQIDAQRPKVDQRATELIRVLGEVRGIERAPVIGEKVRAAVARLKEIRAIADAEMGKTGFRRNKEITGTLAPELQAMTRAVFDLGVLAEGKDASIPADVAVGLALQRLGWEMREYTSQDQTLFLIAAAWKSPVDSNLLADMAARFARAEETARTAQLYSDATALPPATLAALQRAGQQLLGEYARQREGMVLAATTGTFPLSFEEFAGKSAGQLATLAALSEAGATLALDGAARRVREVRTSLVLIVGVMAIGLTLVAGLVWLMVFRVSRRIDGITGLMQRLAGGDLSVDAQRYRGGDEIGRMAGAVTVFRDNAERVLELEAEQRSLADAADRERKASLSALAEGFENAVGGIVDAVTEASADLEAAARSMATIAEQTSARSHAATDGTQRATGNVLELSAAANQLAAAVGEISEQVTTASAIACHAEAESRAAGQQVSELSQAAEGIGAVLTMISTIAEQTNLPALNATIEAARAGDFGKGFAVVASEVKALANQTAKATGDINAQITDIRNSTGRVSGAIEGITSIIRQISSASASIAVAVEEQGASTKEIARNVEEASDATSKIAATMDEVSAGAASASGASEKVLQAASSLSRQADRLRSEMSGFLATIRSAA